MNTAYFEVQRNVDRWPTASHAVVIITSSRDGAKRPAHTTRRDKWSAAQGRLFGERAVDVHHSMQRYIAPGYVTEDRSPLMPRLRDVR